MAKMLNVVLYGFFEPQLKIKYSKSYTVKPI